MPCCQLNFASSDTKLELDAKSLVKKDLEEQENSRLETLSEMTDNFSEADSELESFLSDKVMKFSYAFLPHYWCAHLKDRDM